jgi:arylsulfatase A-like enzyme
VALLVALTAAAVPARAAAQYELPPPPPPNIVFVLTDDLSFDLLRFMPAVQDLMADGVSFDRYIVSSSLCCPSRTSILTGKLPHNSGVLTNLPPLGGHTAFVRENAGASTFATSLSAAGYRTALMGKFINGYHPSFPPPPGFTDWQASNSGYRGHDYRLNVNGVVRRYGSRPRDFINEVLTRSGVQFIQDSADAGAPFMLEVSTFSPHAPYAFAARDRGRYSKVRVPRTRAYDRLNVGAPDWLGRRRPLLGFQRSRLDHVYRKRIRAVLSVDRLLAKLREQLSYDGIADNTYVVFSSDNGFHIGDHRLLPGKRTPFDTDIRVPLVVAGPGIPPDTDSNVLAQNTDLRPTFEALAGLPRSPDVDGLSLTPWLFSPTLAGGRSAAIVEYVREAFKPYADPDAQTRKQGNPPDHVVLRLPLATYVEYATGEREYYDLRADPFQLKNVYDGLPAETQALLAERLAQLRTCSGIACWF